MPAQHNHFASLQKDLHFYVPGKTIHSQVKYVIMNYFDQEAKKYRHSIGKLLVATMVPHFHPLL